MFPLVHLWVRAAAAVELHWEAQQVSDGPGRDPDDVRQLSCWRAPLLPHPQLQRAPGVVISKARRGGWVF